MPHTSLKKKRRRTLHPQQQLVDPREEKPNEPIQPVQQTPIEKTLEEAKKDAALRWKELKQWMDSLNQNTFYNLSRLVIRKKRRLTWRESQRIWKDILQRYGLLDLPTTPHSPRSIHRQQPTPKIHRRGINAKTKARQKAATTYYKQFWKTRRSTGRDLKRAARSTPKEKDTIRDILPTELGLEVPFDLPPDESVRVERTGGKHGRTYRKKDSTEPVFPIEKRRTPTWTNCEEMEAYLKSEGIDIPLDCDSKGIGISIKGSIF